MNLDNPRITSYSSDSLSNYRIWSADATITNNTKDTISFLRTHPSNIICCEVHFYIVKAKNVYIGVHEFSDYFVETSHLYPLDTNHYKMIFILEKEFAEMDALYLRIALPYSLPSMPLDTTTFQHPCDLSKHVKYKPSYLYQVDKESKKIKQVDFDIDASLKKAGYKFTQVDFF